MAFRINSSVAIAVIKFSFPTPFDIVLQEKAVKYKTPRQNSILFSAKDE